MAGSADELEEQVRGAIIDATDPDHYDGRKIARAAIQAVLRGVREKIDALADDPPVTPHGRHPDWAMGWQDCGMEISAELRDLITDPRKRAEG